MTDEAKGCRANYVGAPNIFHLHNACRLIGDAFGHGHTYLVGSCMERRDFRDVDVRFIMDDEEFDAMFPGLPHSVLGRHNAKWSLLCTTISDWLSTVSGLPVDFQFQRRTNANQEFKGPRSALGMFFAKPDLPTQGEKG